VIADRVTALIVLLILAAVGFLAEPGPLRALTPHLTARTIGLSSVALVAAAVVSSWVVWRMVRVTALAARIGRVFLAVRQCFVLNPRLALAFLSALALHVLNFSIVFLFARSLGLTLTYGQVLLMMPVILFLVMVPITINGHGLRELILIAYFGAMGITLAGHPDSRVQDTAVALSLLTVGNDLLWSLPGGLWYLSRGRRRFVPVPATNQ
jgi:hypothetical protein